jgi:8-amino-7-oxononanoate synthase
VSSLDEALAEDLRRLDAAGLRRELRRWQGAQGPWIELDGVRLSSFSSNNYLGLAGHPVLTQAAIAVLEQAGLGAGASRLIAGNHAEHQTLEEDLARFHRVDAALVFNSGFQANVGVIPALVGREDLVLSDRLNHASLIDGCRLARAQVRVYDHADAGHARGLAAESRRSHRRCLIVSESVFSMDGDRAPLAELAAIAAEYDAWLMVDEAHAVGALGPGGRGLCAEGSIIPDILVGTLGKAFGSFGAYVAGSARLRAFLVHRARSFVFSTAQPPALAAASRASLGLLAGQEGTDLRSDLGARITQFRDGLARLGLLAPGAGAAPVFPIHVGDDAASLDISRRLQAAGIHAQAIRPPTVPRGTARLRFALMATHDPTQLDQALTELGRLIQAGHLPTLTTHPPAPRPAPRR